MRLAGADAAAAWEGVNQLESHPTAGRQPPPSRTSASERRSKPQDGCFQAFDSGEAAAAVCRGATQEAMRRSRAERV